MPTTVRVDLPPRFYRDHVERDLPAGTVVKRLKHSVRVDLDQEAYDDLLSDAEYYSTPEYFPKELLGLCMSARATLRRLKKVERPTTD